MSETNHLAIIGALHVDDIARSSSPIVSKASNPVSWEQRVGGVAANAARAASLVGLEQLNIDLIAAVGDDAMGRSLATALSACNVKPKLHMFTECSTGRYSAILNDDGELYLGLADVALAEQLDSTHIRDMADLDAYSALLVDSNLSSQCLASLATLATTMNMPLAALTVSPSKSLRLLAIVDQISLLFCNRREAMALIANDAAAAETGSITHVSIERLADDLSNLGFRQFVLTDGKAPLLVQDASKRCLLNAPEIDKPYTVNGAGDALAGASFAAWASGGMDLQAAVEFHGLRVASDVVRGTYQALCL
ncbi:MAG: PfkB family carbohydrate kinase [Granulosicoccus sp.]